MKRISLAFVTGRASTRRNHPLNTPSSGKKPTPATWLSRFKHSSIVAKRRWHPAI